MTADLAGIAAAALAVFPSAISPANAFLYLSELPAHYHCWIN
jgi:hypothetical protein